MGQWIEITWAKPLTVPTGYRRNDGTVGKSTKQVSREILSAGDPWEARWDGTAGMLRVHERPFSDEDEWWFYPPHTIASLRYFMSNTCPRCQSPVDKDNEHAEKHWPCFTDPEPEPEVEVERKGVTMYEVHSRSLCANCEHAAEDHKVDVEGALGHCEMHNPVGIPCPCKVFVLPEADGDEDAVRANPEPWPTENAAEKVLHDASFEMYEVLRALKNSYPLDQRRQKVRCRSCGEVVPNEVYRAHGLTHAPDCTWLKANNLVGEIDRLVNEVIINGVKVMPGSLKNTPPPEGLDVAIGNGNRFCVCGHRGNQHENHGTQPCASYLNRDDEERCPCERYRQDKWRDNDIAFKVGGTPCPKCKQERVIGYYLIAQDGGHQHTHYVCTSWPHPGERCGWHGWTVPT